MTDNSVCNRNKGIKQVGVARQSSGRGTVVLMGACYRLAVPSCGGERRATESGDSRTRYPTFT
ncbi:hypothetical protein XENTR_v10013414 [Xenopus tropicalis]|nr:hypothetical protein XENTR_v10013414 [Xenopus tropicalis]